jgi:hypothetical protein
MQGALMAGSGSEPLPDGLTDKSQVIVFLKRTLGTLRAKLTESSDVDLEATGPFFGEHTSARRVYLRALCHLHEHMGQLIGYTPVLGFAGAVAGLARTGQEQENDRARPIRLARAICHFTKSPTAFRNSPG